MSRSGRGTHRAKLLEAAQVLLVQRGYGSITARDLVAASNTNLGSIGYHFGSKEALLNEAIGLALEEWAEAIGRATRAAPGAHPLALMTSSLRALLDEFDSIRPYYHAFIEALALSAHSPELRNQLAAHYNRQRSRVAGWIADSLGDALEPHEARHLASLMIAAADGLLLQSFINPDDVPTSRELAATAKGFTTALDHSMPSPQRGRGTIRPPTT